MRKEALVWDGRLTPGVAVYFAFMALFLVLGVVGAGLGARRVAAA